MKLVLLYGGGGVDSELVLLYGVVDSEAGVAGRGVDSEAGVAVWGAIVKLVLLLAEAVGCMGG